MPQQVTDNTEVFAVDPRLLGRITDAPPEEQHRVAIEVQAEIKAAEEQPPELIWRGVHRSSDTPDFDGALGVMEIQLGYNPLDYVAIMGQVARLASFPLAKLPAPYRKVAMDFLASRKVYEGEVVEPPKATPATLAGRNLALTKGPGVRQIPQQQTKENNP